MAHASFATNNPAQLAANTSPAHLPTNVLPRRRRRRGRAWPKTDGEETTRLQTQARSEAETTRLNGNAPEFVPASVAPTTSQASARRHQYRKQRHGRHRIQQSATPPATTVVPPSRSSNRPVSPSRSTAPDVATRIHEDITNSIYECAICTNRVSKHSSVWSCRSCWTVFHIGCIKKWSRNEGSAAAPVQTEDGQPQTSKQWRCPGCNLPQSTLPSSYHCWCEKEQEPRNIPGLPPHSCGQTCGRQRTFPRPCPHPCELTCHAGPCPPCANMGPSRSCFCAEEMTSRRCVDTNYDSGWSCGKACGDVMPCGRHTCARPCHEGLCGVCEVQVDARCYCAKVNRTMKCHELEEETKIDGLDGRFDCHQPCKRVMDCGIHECEKTCHPLDQQPSHCPRSPDLVMRCPCRKSSLSTLLDQPRTACTDPIPSCKQLCGRRLGCGHTCEQLCHAGNCPPCLQTYSIPCGCGRTRSEIVCHQQAEEPPRCLRICRTHLNCGRHECGERCCTGERKAVDRQASRKKTKTVGLDLVRQLGSEIEPEHICTRACGRLLKCKNHMCQDLCHKGPCDTCKEAIFEDLSCNCGRTVLQAPLPCGTRTPPCPFPCQRVKTCDHPQTAHSCHGNDESCPKCPYLTEKRCMCGKKSLKNQACWRSQVSCGLVCGRRLKCGSHSCQKTCHRGGECEDSVAACQQPCGKAKKKCSHPCEKPCHAPSVCREDKVCSFKVIITCQCQRKKEEVRCNARAGMADQAGDPFSLKCDDECARLERNRNLASALHISDDHSDDHVPYSTASLTMYLGDIKWAHVQEELLRAFAADPNERRLRFPPMKGGQRAFIHSLAEDFGFDGESMDPEPHRHVVLFKTPKFVAAPMKTLQQAARIKRAALNIGAPIHNVADPSSSAGSGISPKGDPVVRQWNAVILTQPRFGLTMGDLKPHVLKAAPTTQFDLYFLTDADRVLLIPSSNASSSENPHHVSQLLEYLEPVIAAQITKHKLANYITLGFFEFSAVAEPCMIYEKNHKPESNFIAKGGDGWSQVAAKGAAPAKAPPAESIGQRPVYTVLGSRLAESKKKKKLAAERKQGCDKIEAVVDNWEEEAEKEGGEED